MTEPTSDADAIKVTEKLLAYYNFQDEVQTREQLLDSWLRSHPLDWVRLALIEALYQGRYKSASVEYLLQLWQRRGHPIYHFSREFERLVCHNCPKTFLSLLQVPQAPESEQDSHQIQTNGMDHVLSLPAETASIEQAIISGYDEPEMIALDIDELSDPEEGNPHTHGDIAEPPMSNAEITFPKEVSVTLTEDSESDLDWLKNSGLEQLTARSISPNRRVNSAAPIHRFTPSSRPSELYTKLAAMANAQA